VTWRILVPIDFSETSFKALPEAARLAFALPAELTLIHVLASGGARRSLAPGSSKPPPSEVMDADAKQGDELKRVREEYLPELDDVTLQIVSGESAAEAIANQAERMQANMIVMSSHGRTGLSHVLMGSVAEAVVKSATCPVLIVP
jgi:nucleotide-binding universal stress UspA family protein